MKISLLNLKDYLEVSDSSPTGLLWKKDNLGINGRKYSSIGDAAGSIKHYHGIKNSCWIILIGNVRYYAHRIIFSILGTELTAEDVVDHIDGNSLNNKLSNLRVTTQSFNMRNAKRSSCNSTGVTGVSYTQRKGKHPVYIATWYDLLGSLKTKEFSTFKHSDKTCLLLASNYRALMIKELNEQGAGYTTRHGT